MKKETILLILSSLFLLIIVVGIVLSEERIILIGTSCYSFIIFISRAAKVTQSNINLFCLSILAIIITLSTSSEINYIFATIWFILNLIGIFIFNKKKRD